MTSRYTTTAISLHWLIAIGIAGTFSLGVYMHELPLSPTKLQLYSWHKWAGVTLFALIVLRLLWRATHAAPPLPADTPPMQRLAAAATHWVLYALMIAVPVSGWLMSSAKGFQTVWFGIVPLPDLVTKNAELGDFLKEVHETLNLTMLGLVLLHAAAALKHHFIDRDDVLTRMLPAADRNA